MKIHSGAMSIILLVISFASGCDNLQKEGSGDQSALTEPSKPFSFQAIEPWIPDTCIVTSGQVLIQQDAEDSLVVNLYLQIKQTLDCATPDLANSIEGLYFPGVQHVFNGECRLPIAPIGFDYINFHTQIQNIGDRPFGYMIESGGAVYYGGPIRIVGPATAVLMASAKVLKVFPDKLPMVFEVTTEGYRHIRGGGTVQMANGACSTFAATPDLGQ